MTVEQRGPALAHQPVAPSRGWVFYDGDCGFCTAIVTRFRKTLEDRGYGVAKLQDPLARQTFGALSPGQLLEEMRLVTPTGAQFGGADAFVMLAREIWWAWPLTLLARLPGGRPLLKAGYRWVARRRRCTSIRPPR